MHIPDQQRVHGKKKGWKKRRETVGVRTCQMGLKPTQFDEVRRTKLYEHRKEK